MRFAQGSESPSDSRPLRRTPMEEQFAKMSMHLKKQDQELQQVMQKTQNVEDQLEALMKILAKRVYLRRCGLKRGLLAATFALTAIPSALLQEGWERAILGFIAVALGVVSYSYLKRYFTTRDVIPPTRKESEKGELTTTAPK